MKRVNFYTVFLTFFAFVVFTNIMLAPASSLFPYAASLNVKEAWAVPVSTNINFADLAEKLSPTVVNVNITKTVKSRGFRMGPGRSQSPFFGGDDFFQRFFGDIPEKDFKQKGLGSGFIISKDGYIITNNHVIQNADKIKVKLSNGREYDAQVKGKDPTTDIALIKITPRENLTAVEFGDSDKLRVGEWVFAIGNPFGLSQTVTAGIVSAKERVIGSGPYDDFIQTDASINPGNSGGPLFNLEGKVVGINTAIVAQGQGIGFAVPINMAKAILDELKSKGKVTRGWLGISVQDITDDIAESLKIKERKGSLVGQVFEGEPADAAGVKSGDIIIGINGKNFRDTHELLKIVATLPIGKKANLKILRDGKVKDYAVVIGERKDSAELAKQEKSNEQFGMTVNNITPEMARQLGVKEKTGVIVTRVKEGSSADEANIKPQDIILEVNQRRISSVKDYIAETSRIKAGDIALMLVKRGKIKIFVTLRKESAR